MRKIDALRIAVVTQYFHPEDFRVNDLVTQLVARGHDLQVLTGNPNYPSGRFAPGYGGVVPRRGEACGARVTRVPLIARGNASGLRLVGNYLSFAASATILGPMLVRDPVDVVLAYQLSPVTVGGPALALGRTKGVPVLMWVQDLWPHTLAAMGVLRSSGAKRSAGWATGALHRAMDALLIQSPAFRRPLEEQGVAPSRITYVPNWAEAFYRPIAVPASAPERGVLPSGFTVMFAGNLGEAQALDTLLGAAQLLTDVPDLHWVILGEGRRLQWLRDEIASRRLQGHMQLLGRKPAETMPTWFGLADVLVATLRPDPVYELTVPSKLQSYLACGRPVVVSMDGEGARVVERAGAGEVAPAGDPAALALAVRRLYGAKPTARAEMGRRARAYYLEHFERDRVIDQVEQLLVGHVSRRRKGFKS